MTQRAFRAPFRSLALFLALAASLFAVYLGALARSRRETPAPSPALGYAGTRACGECHPQVAAEHTGTHHAHALRAARSSEPVSPGWLRDPDLPQAYRVTQRDGSAGIEAQLGSSESWQPVHWAFGSGTHATTLVGRRSDGSFVESPLTSYRRAGWDFTPGYLANPTELRRSQPTGHVLAASEASDCFRCHAAGVPEGEPFDLARGAEPGVQCESCHGPGAEHVRQARSGGSPAGLRLPAGCPATEQVARCGACHRTQLPDGVRATDPVAVRFAPVGLQRSRCYRESPGHLSCTACHSPHRDASNDAAPYNAVCASCHGRGARGAACPKEPQGNCVACHMPRRMAERNAFFTDHWIRRPSANSGAH